MHSVSLYCKLSKVLSLPFLQTSYPNFLLSSQNQILSNAKMCYVGLGGTKQKLFSTPSTQR